MVETLFGRRLSRWMAAALPATIYVSCTILGAEPGDHKRSIEVGSLTRSYIVHVPPSYDGSRPFPVVLVFHGGGSNAPQMIRFCGLNEKADAAGFIAVYQEGLDDAA